MDGGWGPRMTTWFYRGVGQMTMFDHNGGGRVEISENLSTWYMDASLHIRRNQIIIKVSKNFRRFG